MVLTGNRVRNWVSNNLSQQASDCNWRFERYPFSSSLWRKTNTRSISLNNRQPATFAHRHSSTISFLSSNLHLALNWLAYYHELVFLFCSRHFSSLSTVRSSSLFSAHAQRGVISRLWRALDLSTNYYQSCLCVALHDLPTIVVRCLPLNTSSSLACIHRPGD